MQGLRKPFSRELNEKYDKSACDVIMDFLLRISQGKITNLGRCFSNLLPDIHYDLNSETKFIEAQVSTFWTEEYNPEAWADMRFPLKWCGVLERKLHHARIHGPKVKYYNLSLDLSRAWIMPGEIVARAEKEFGIVDFPNKLYPSKGVQVPLENCYIRKIICL